MLKKSIIALTVALAAFGSVADASNVIAQNYGSGATLSTTHPVLSTAGTPVANGVIAFGYFSVTDLTVQAATTTAAWQSVVGQFQQFGATSTFGTGAGGTPGLYRVTVGEAVPAASEFDGKNIYTVLGNAATLAASTQVLVFRSNTQFAVDPTPSANANLFGDPLGGQLLLGSLADSASVVYTGAPAPAAYQNVAFRSLSLQNVPEPSSLIFGLLGLLGILRRRR